VDPIAMDLLFEHFLSEERGEWFAAGKIKVDIRPVWTRLSI
jgi:hypothetical protein